MPKKSLKKKKHYQAACRQRAYDGMIPSANGDFVTSLRFKGLPGVNTESPIRDYFAGYKLAGKA